MPMDLADARATGQTLSCSRRWTIDSIAQLRSGMDHLVLPAGDNPAIDGSGITAMDTAGAWLLLQIRRRLQLQGAPVPLQGFHPEHEKLLEYVAGLLVEASPPQAERRAGSWLAGVPGISRSLVDFLSFTGEVVFSLLRSVRYPARVRWCEIMDDIRRTGIMALPIVGLLSFLMGVVIAYQGAVQLKLYGANIYLADLVGYSMLRELAPLLAAILLCGRTASSYTAQIGTMQVREEVAALQTMGISPVDMLVLPKLVSLVIVMPLISVYADILSVFGGMVMANYQLGVGFNAFISRLGEAVSYSTFMIGIGKAPVFAVIIAVVGCYQGFRVSGSAASVGRHTTISVVQSIFLVIVVDAMFSILFSLLGV